MKELVRANYRQLPYRIVFVNPKTNKLCNEGCALLKADRMHLGERARRKCCRGHGSAHPYRQESLQELQDQGSTDFGSITCLTVAMSYLSLNRLALTLTPLEMCPSYSNTAGRVRHHCDVQQLLLPHWHSQARCQLVVYDHLYYFQLESSNLAMGAWMQGSAQKFGNCTSKTTRATRYDKNRQKWVYRHVANPVIDSTAG